MSFINDIMDKGKEFMEDQVEKGLDFIGQDGESDIDSLQNNSDNLNLLLFALSANIIENNTSTSRKTLSIKSLLINVSVYCRLFLHQSER